jgi:hypothetical protein
MHGLNDAETVLYCLTAAAPQAAGRETCRQFYFGSEPAQPYAPARWMMVPEQRSSNSNTPSTRTDPVHILSREAPDASVTSDPSSMRRGVNMTLCFLG